MLASVVQLDPADRDLADEFALIFKGLRASSRFCVEQFLLAAAKGEGGSLLLTNSCTARTKRSIPEARYLPEGFDLGTIVVSGVA